MGSGFAAAVQETLTQGAFDRLSGYKILAEKQGLLRDGVYVGEARVVFAKVCQNPEHQNAVFCDVAPAILTNTFLWDLAKDMPIVPASHWLIMGFGHPLVPSVSMHTSCFPCPAALIDVRTGLCAKTQRILTGNAMHVAAIGSWSLFNFVSIDASRLPR